MLEGCSCRPLTLSLGPGFYLCGRDARLCPVWLWDAVRHLQVTGVQAIMWQKPESHWVALRYQDVFWLAQAGRRPF